MATDPRSLSTRLLQSPYAHTLHKGKDSIGPLYRVRLRLPGNQQVDMVGRDSQDTLRAALDRADAIMATPPRPAGAGG